MSAVTPATRTPYDAPELFYSYVKLTQAEIDELLSKPFRAEFHKEWHEPRFYIGDWYFSISWSGDYRYRVFTTNTKKEQCMDYEQSVAFVKHLLTNLQPDDIVVQSASSRGFAPALLPGQEARKTRTEPA